MIQNNFTKTDSERVSVEQAEDAVSDSLLKFESAMDMLAEKVEDTSQKVQNALGMASLTKDKLVQLRDQTAAAIDPLRPYIDKTAIATKKALNEVKENPRPYLFAALGVISSCILFTYIRDMEKRPPEET